MTTPSDLLDLCRAKSVRVATAESCTGGMVGTAITNIAGSSDIFDCGFITYSNAAKVELLGVRAATLAAHGAVSEEVAREMAKGALARSAAHIAVSITGIAGPGGSENKPEGRVCFGLAWGDEVIAETQEFGPQGRANVRRHAMEHALGMLARAARKFPLG